jgi:hypothetical protein
VLLERLGTGDRCRLVVLSHVVHPPPASR